MTPRNLAELHHTQADRLGPRPALRHKQHGLYRDYTWHTYRADALACAAALVEAGVQPGDRVGLFAENRLDWLVADIGILAAGAVCVTPHAPLTARQVQYELADSGCSWLFVSTRGQRDKIDEVRAELPELRGLVSFDPLDGVSWQAFLANGRRRLGELEPELRRREETLDRESLATIMYTSGTTGKPKGVMLTHGNILSNVAALQLLTPPVPDDVRLSWLPYSHIYARTVDHYLAIASGTLMYLAESAETLVTNLAECQPTHMNAVPRFYEKVYSTHSEADPARTAKRLRNVFGPRVRFLSSGGAPLPPAIAKAFHDAGLMVLQGYGLTESSPVISFNSPQHFKLESVGQPVPGVEVKIGPDGEVLTRGPHVMKGYWKNEQATAEAIRDGWLHTGDLGTLDADGFLSITGRKKELMVLSSGKKIVPPYLEGLLIADPHIDQAMVCGEGKSFLTALIVPAWDSLRAALELSGPPEQLAREPAVQRFLEQRISAALKDVCGWEHVKKFVVLDRAFSVADEELTVSLKMRRNIIMQHHGARIEQLYRKD